MMPKKNIEDVLHVTPYISDKMADAIQLWADMYEGHSPWLREPTYDNPDRVVSLGLPALIASEKARMATLEMKSEISAPTEEVSTHTSGLQSSSVFGKVDAQPATGSNDVNKTTNAEAPENNERAKFLNCQYKKVLKQIRRQLEYGIAKGGLVIKPYVVFYKNDSNDSDKNTAGTQPASTPARSDVSADKLSSNDKTLAGSDATKTVRTGRKPLPKAEFEFDYVQADRFFPLTFDSNGKVTEAAFIQTKLDKAKERVYIRLEHHKLENHKVIIQNFAFESTDITLAESNNLRCVANLGVQIALTDVPEWAGLEPYTEVLDVDRLLFAYFKMPEANTIDPYSPLGVSGYSRVVRLIQDADEQYSRMLWEFEGGELALDVDRNALAFITDPNSKSHSVLPRRQQRLFRQVDLNAEDTYNIFSPALRDNSIAHGLNIMLQRIEDASGISRGTLSDITSVEAKTATELKILKQRSYATNADIQSALQDCLEDLVYVMDAYCWLYDLTPGGDYEVSFEWDDSIIIDSESELSKRITLMQNGLASKLETRMWYFGETKNQAQAALDQVDAEAQKAAEQKAEQEQMQAAAMQEVEKDAGYDIKSPADTTGKKISTGQQADDLDKPNKSKDAAALRDDEEGK